VLRARHDTAIAFYSDAAIREAEIVNETRHGAAGYDAPSFPVDDDVEKSRHRRGN